MDIGGDLDKGLSLTGRLAMMRPCSLLPYDGLTRSVDPEMPNSKSACPCLLAILIVTVHIPLLRRGM